MDNDCTFRISGDERGIRAGALTITLLPSTGHSLTGITSQTVIISDTESGGDGGISGIKSGVPIPDSPIPEIDPTVIDGARLMAEQTHLGAEHVDRWNRVLAAFGIIEHDNPMTVAEAQNNTQKYSNPLWQQIVDTLKKIEAIN